MQECRLSVTTNIALNMYCECYITSPHVLCCSVLWHNVVRMGVIQSHDQAKMPFRYMPSVDPFSLHVWQAVRVLSSFVFMLLPLAFL